MGLFGIIVALGAAGFLALIIGMQLTLRRKSRAMTGAPLPVLEGEVGQRIAKAQHALVYFFSPSCGACRAITPRVRALEKSNAGVFAVDVTQQLDLARALSVMATPSTLEIRNDVIVGYHVGPIPDAVLARFG